MNSALDCLIALVPHLKLRAEPEVDDDVLVELAPDVERGQHHGVHQERDPHEERDDHAADPVERQHEEVVRRPTVEDPEDEKMLGDEFRVNPSCTITYNHYIDNALGLRNEC